MKKRIILLFVLLTFVLVCLTACNNPSANDYQKINELLKKDYSKVTVVVSTKTDVATLIGNFTLTFDNGATNVDYKFDKLNTFETDTDGNIGNADGNFIVSVEGSAVVREGLIVEGDAAVDLPLDQLNISGLSFKQAFFRNATLKNAKFEADVTSPQKFTGNDALVCTDMHVVVVRNTNSDTLTSIEITYTSENGAAVKINYVFTK